MLLFPLMYMIALRPTGRAEELLLTVATILWPTSPVLMAVQGTSSMSFRVAIFCIAVLSNGLLYGLVAVIVGIMLSKLGLVVRR
jgi:hypothetical protein